MRPSRTFTISLPPDLVTDVDRLAAQEHRSRSELFREVFRRYVNSQRRWEHFFDLGPRSAVADELDTEETIDAAVDEAIRVVLDTNIIVSGILALWLSSRATNLYQSSCKVVTGAGATIA